MTPHGRNSAAENRRVFDSPHLTYKEKYNHYVHYQVDRMEQIALTDVPRVLPDKPFDLSAYAKSMFQMFGGEEILVSMEFANELVGAVYDRFGIDVPILKRGDTRFVCQAKVAVSPHFLAWIIAFGGKARILAPDTVVEQLRALLRQAEENYK